MTQGPLLPHQHVRNQKVQILTAIRNVNPMVLVCEPDKQDRYHDRQRNGPEIRKRDTNRGRRATIPTSCQDDQI